MWSTRVLSLAIVLTSAWGQLGDRPWSRPEETPKEVISDDQSGEGVVFQGTSYAGAVGVNRAWTPRNWRGVSDTFIGCLAHQYIFDGNMLYVNLTQIGSLLHGEKDRTESCFYLCHNKMAFAEYISITLGPQGGTDQCGCHYEFDLSFHLEEDDTTCNGSLKHSRLYCGPGNIACFNNAPRPLGLSNGLVSLVLLVSAVQVFAFSR